MNHETHRMVAVGVQLTIQGTRHIIVPKAWNAQQIEAHIGTLGDPNFDVNMADVTDDVGAVSLLTNDKTAVCSFDKVTGVEYIHPIFEVTENREILSMENHPDFVEEVKVEPAPDTKLKGEGPEAATDAETSDPEPREPLRS